MAKILNVRVDNLSFSETMHKIADFLAEEKLHQIATVNPEFIVAAQKDKEFKEVLNSADLNVPDGFGLKLAAIVTRQQIGERITGVDLTWELAKIAEEKGYSIYFLGAKEGVAVVAVQKMKILYPELKIAGTSSKNPDDSDVLDDIKNANPDILLVAYGAPKQDKFINRIKNEESRIKNLKIAMGVGGTFDYIAGVLPRAPKWMRSLGLEWLYRLIRQPSRIGRIYTALIKFPLLVLFKRSK